MQTRIVVGLLVALLVFLVGGVLVFPLIDFALNSYTEVFIGTLTTSLLVNIIYNYFADKRAKDQAAINEAIAKEQAAKIEAMAKERAEQAQFDEWVLDMGGESNEFAKRAVRMLRHHPKEYLTSDDRYLKGKNFSRGNLTGARLRYAHLESAGLIAAHLEGADFGEAHLEGAHLEGAHLEGAFLIRTHLEGAFLIGEAHLEGAFLNNAHLEGAILVNAHLEGAKLWDAHLEGAILVSAHLEGADLSGASLAGADLIGDFPAIFSPETIMPDGQFWTQDIILERYIDPTREDFFDPSKK